MEVDAASHLTNASSASAAAESDVVAAAAPSTAAKDAYRPLLPRHPTARFPMMLARCLHHDVKISRHWSSSELDEYRNVIVLEFFKERLLSYSFVA